MLCQSTLAFIHTSDTNSDNVFKLGEIVPTFFAASNSVILSLAAYLTWKFPFLPHPDYPAFQIEDPPISETFPTPELSLHPLHEAWTDTLCMSVIGGNAVRVDSTLYILIPIKTQFAKELKKLNWKAEAYLGETSIESVFGVSQTQQKDKKIILMNFAASQLRENQLAPRINLPALILGTLFDNQKWSFYCALRGEVPAKQEIMKADTIILPGSSNSVLDSIEPVDVFVGELKQAYEENRKLKILSVCYGHQLVAKFQNAKVVRKHRYQGHQTVKFDKSLTSKYGFLNKITQHTDQQFIMPEHHEDYVETVPEGFDLIASSSSCFVEAMVKRDGRIFSLQFHPEYFSQYTVAFTKRVKLAEPHYHLSFALAVAEDKLDFHHQSCTFVRECIKQFIASEPQSQQIWE